MYASKPPVFARHDTFFGVCEALGQDLGFNPNYLRMIFALAILPAPVAVISIYVGLGLLVALSRLMFPDRVAKTLAVAEPARPALPEGQNDQDGDEIALAA